MQEIYLSAAEVAEHLDISYRTIENWAASRKINQDDRGKYGLISAFNCQIQQLKQENVRFSESLDECRLALDKPEASAKIRKLKAEADKEETLAAIKILELEKLVEKLVDSQEVEEAWANLVANCCAKFNGLPAKLALELSGMKPEEIQARLSQAIDEALFELAGK